MQQTFGAFLVALLAATGLAASIPSPRSSPETGRFTAPVVRNAHHKRNGPRALARAYIKFGKPLPDDLAAYLARDQASSKVKRSTGSVANAPQADDTEYLSNVQIGTPAQTLPLDFDTGSADLWVFSTETESSDVDGQTLYNPSDSSTAQLLSGETWSISYGDGSSSSGDVYSDVVTVGGLSVSGQAVESAQQVSSTFTSDTASSGLLGLAWSSINTVQPDQQNTFFANAQSSLDSPVFTVDLKHDAGTLGISAVFKN